jgi:hypothetical protein
MKMPFGKHAGVELTEVPRQYLRWLKGQKWVGGWLVKEINDVLDGKVVAESDVSFEEALKKWEQQEQQPCGGNDAQT